VYPARGPDGKQLLATRLLDQAQPMLLPGTENGHESILLSRWPMDRLFCEHSS
jgi:hypothetical protein